MKTITEKLLQSPGYSRMPLMSSNLKAFNVIEIEEEELCPSLKDSDDSWYQPSLKLESTSELNDNLRSAIARYKQQQENVVLSQRWIKMVSLIEEYDEIEEKFREFVFVVKMMGYDF